jgi:hypothetical protein
VPFNEAQAESARLTTQLLALGVLTPADIAALAPPAVRDVERRSLLGALGMMIRFDVTFPFRVRRIRRKAMRLRAAEATHAGAAGSTRDDVERAIGLAREQAQLAKRFAFYSKSRRLLQLWHVVHRPFSSSFAVLVSIHVLLMLMLGFY